MDLGRIRQDRVAILVKALPQPSSKHGETVCCAGVTRDGKWKRLFPVRFRRLEGDAAFGRWDWVDYRYREPTADRRTESCHVFEDSIMVVGKLAERERAPLLNPLVLGSGKAAAERGQSLTLVRPRNPRFLFKRKSVADVERDREAFCHAARQDDIFDEKLAEIEPTPYEFIFKFDDDDGSHIYRNGDWETHAAFFHHRRRTSEEEALRWLGETYNEKYPAKGMAFVLGNVASRPQTWQLLGVIRLDLTRETEQSDLFA